MLVEAEHWNAQVSEPLGLDPVEIGDHQVDAVELIGEGRALLNLCPSAASAVVTRLASIRSVPIATTLAMIERLFLLAPESEAGEG